MISVRIFLKNSANGSANPLGRASWAGGWEGPARREREFFFIRVGRGLGGQAGDKCQLNESQLGDGILFFVACLRCLPHNAGREDAVRVTRLLSVGDGEMLID